MSFEAPRGVVAPLLTPFNDDLSIASDLYLGHAKSMLDQGCGALAPFGTTGEALSVGIDERIEAVRGLIDGGIDPALLIPGTGLSNLADTARLSRVCLDLGCRAVMTLPPFYYKNVSDDGIYRYFAELIDRIGDDVRIFLYHIPPIAIVGIPPAVAARLHKDFPEQVVGIKDSSGDWENTKQLFDIDGLIVYPGSELPLVEALELGGPGCISATANLNARAIARCAEMHAAGDIDTARQAQVGLSRIRLTIQDYGPIPAQKRLLAIRSGDERWANVRPPLDPLSKERGLELMDMLAS